MTVWQCRGTSGGTCYEWVIVLERERVDPPSCLMKRVLKGFPIPMGEPLRVFKEVKLKAPPTIN